MTDDATKTKAGGSPRLSEELGPLPRPEWMAGAHTQAWRLETVLSWPTENARRYTAPLFTVDQMLAYAVQERTAERATFSALCDRAVQDFAPDGLGGDFGHGFRSACELLKQAIERGPNFN